MTVTETERQWAMIACLGAIFLGPFAPLIVWVAEGRRSPFVRQHVAQAANLTLTFLFYAISVGIATGLLALASLVTALTIMSVVLALGWVLLVVQLIRCASAGSHGAFTELPHWMCATIISGPDGRGSPGGRPGPDGRGNPGGRPGPDGRRS